MGISEIMYVYGLSVFSVSLIFLITYLQLKVNKSELRQWCIMMLTCSLITNISIMFQIVNIMKYNLQIFYEAFALIGINIMPICWYLAVNCYIDEKFKFSKKNSWIFIIPIFSIIATFTNDYHHLVFKTFSTNFSEREYGIIFWIMFANIAITSSLAVINIFKHFSKNFKENRSQVSLALLFIIVPIVIGLLGNLKILDMKSYANGIVGSLISIITIEILLKYQILTAISISLLNVLNAISDGFIIINKTGKIIAYNNVFLNLFDLGKLDLEKMNIYDLLDFREFDTLEKNDIEKIVALKDTKKNVTFERTSEKLKLTLKFEGMKLSSKRENLYIITVVDITGYFKNIQSIKLNNDALLSKERLASLGQMIGGIAHNLKTPIFSMAGAIEGLEDLTKEYRESISDPTVTIQDHQDIAKDMYTWTEKIEGYLSYMTDIITAIQMQTSKGYSKEGESFTVKELVKYINILMKYELKQNLINLQVNIKMDESKKINGNINGLIQVLNNLISNSIQAYSSDVKDKKIILDIYENKKSIILDVTDFAGGIPNEVKNKLFKEMVTTKGKNGTGLGLFISYTSIKTGFGGNLSFKTKLGEGTVFRITIPEK